MFAGPAGQIAVRLLALRIRGGEITNHAKLLIVSVSAHTIAGASVLARPDTGRLEPQGWLDCSNAWAPLPSLMLF